MAKEAAIDSSLMSLVLRSTCYVFFQGTAVWLLLGWKRKKKHAANPSHFSAQCHCRQLSLPLAGQGPKFPLVPAQVLDQQVLFQKKLLLIYTWKGLDTALHHTAKNILFPKISS